MIHFESVRKMMDECELLKEEQKETFLTNSQWARNLNLKDNPALVRTLNERGKNFLNGAGLVELRGRTEKTFGLYYNGKKIPGVTYKRRK